ncbi:NAD-dependent epimerase/dehydratase family protein [Bradyrhizobium sp. Ai1a-2]|uniref:NAD-dependent epimerase/dehydratase family protein n=1 Tax=Bradyrhizobium sp. Ai1a-2 TaxID=196490 RepID=UPI0004232677|nr:NAD-dependent epimerase/dehydratase family protein [Bradyrhizobium sp. Ai1a-2]
MKVVVTGATGFVGRHVVACFVREGHSVVAVARDAQRGATMPWHGQAEFVACDLAADFGLVIEHSREADALIHLAWPGLPNYRDFFHIGRNLLADVAFLEAAVAAGTRQLMVAGTCLEYGMQYGPLTEEMETRPHTPYGFAKDALRKSLELLRKQQPFTLQWLRLFYMYGEGQNPNSLLAQLDRAIERGDVVFNMSTGDQLRDYLPVEEVAADFVRAATNSERCSGVINCCSGRPISVFDLVRQRCEARASSIQLNRGHYPYPDYEPMAFWGVPAKLAPLRQAT